MTTPQERMTALRHEQARLEREMREVQREMDASVPVFVLRGKCREKGWSQYRYGPWTMGIFSTFEKALRARTELEATVKTEDLCILAVPKTEARFDRGHGYQPKVLTLDGPVDTTGYVSD